MLALILLFRFLNRLVHKSHLSAIALTPEGNEVDLLTYEGQRIRKNRKIWLKF
jgi:hypothetical protein